MRRVLIIGSTIAALVVAVVVSRSSSSKKPDAIKTTRTVRSFGAIQPRLSPDGSRIVFSYHGAIWRMPRVGGEMTRLTDGEGFDIEPAWSPDGKQIAFINSTNMFNGELQLIEADTGRSIKLPKRVTASGKIEIHADGKRILGNLRADGRNLGLAWFDIQSREDRESNCEL
jgi:Tol biopolymer transport system component